MIGTLASLGQVEVVFDSIMEPDRWLGVEVRHFAALEAVAREGSFGRAAESLGYTQSAISQQIQTLERLVGERLLERPGGPRAVSLTEAGRLLLRHAEAIVARLHAAQADMAALAQRRGRTAPRRHLPERRRARAPRRDAPLHGRVAARRDRADRVVVGRGAACGSSSAASSTSRSRCRRSSRARSRRSRCSPTPTSCSSRPSTSSPKLTRASLADVGDLTLIGNRACRSTALAEGELAQRGVGVDVAFRSDDNGTVQGLVGAGFGVALVPLLATDPKDERVQRARARPGDPAAPDRSRWHRDRHRSPAARAFVEVAAEVCADVAASLSPMPA